MRPTDDLPCGSVGHPYLNLSVWYCQHEQRFTTSVMGGTTDEPNGPLLMDWGPFDTAEDVMVPLRRALEVFFTERMNADYTNF